MAEINAELRRDLETDGTARTILAGQRYDLAREVEQLRGPRLSNEEVATLANELSGVATIPSGDDREFVAGVLAGYRAAERRGAPLRDDDYREDYEDECSRTAEAAALIRRLAKLAGEVIGADDVYVSGSPVGVIEAALGWAKQLAREAIERRGAPRMSRERAEKLLMQYDYPIDEGQERQIREELLAAFDPEPVAVEPALPLPAEVPAGEG